jgi:lysozyme
MKTSQNGLNLIETSEGFRDTIYLDVAGKATIGYGHLIKSGEDFSTGITQEQGQALLQADVEIAEDAVNAHAPQANQNQFDALVDFAFNLGTGALQQMLAHGWGQVPVQILRWNKAGGEIRSGLVRRREAEVTLFNS